MNAVQHPSSPKPSPSAHPAGAPREHPGHRQFVELLEALRVTAHHTVLGTDAVAPQIKRDLQRAILSLGAMLADVRTLLAGEPLPELPGGCFSGMEFELIALDFIHYPDAEQGLCDELNRIHWETATLHAELLRARPGTESLTASRT